MVFLPSRANVEQTSGRGRVLILWSLPCMRVHAIIRQGG
jgi:hypothetical protein